MNARNPNIEGSQLNLSKRNMTKTTQSTPAPCPRSIYFDLYSITTDNPVFKEACSFENNC